MLIEKEMRNFADKKEIKEVYNIIPKLVYNGNNKRISFFVKLYNARKTTTISVYYFIRNIVKRVFYHLKIKGWL